MMQLNSPEVQKSMEEIWNWNCKTAFYKVMENDGLKSTFVWAVFSFNSTPLDNGLALEQFHILQLLHSGLWHLAFLPASCKLGDFFNFRLWLGFLLGHLGFTSRILCSGAIREAKGWNTREAKPGKLGSAIGGGQELKGVKTLGVTT